MTIRQIVRINEELCNGCGDCVTPCAEGAIVLVNGKAKVMDEALCDGAGFCLPVCPTGALSVEGPVYIRQRCLRCANGEDQAPLVPIRYQGQSLWICTRCLPALIHG
jgi:MinD superfamily P-loop ATPase